MKFNILITISFLLMIPSCSKVEKGFPTSVEPKYHTTYKDFINKIEENDSVSIGFEQKTAKNLVEYKTTRELVFYIHSNLAKSELSPKYLQERNEKIRKLSIKGISNIEAFDSIKSIYELKSGEKMTTEIIIDKLKN